MLSRISHVEQENRDRMIYKLLIGLSLQTESVTKIICGGNRFRYIVFDIVFIAHTKLVAYMHDNDDDVVEGKKEKSLRLLYRI